MSKRENPRLAFFGEYFSPDAETSEPVYRARLQLIAATKKVFPEFFKKLSTDVFPLYEQLANSGYEFDRVLWVARPQSPLGLLTDEGGLKQALLKWAGAFNAKAEWVMIGALRSLRGWHLDPNWHRSFWWDTLHSTSGLGRRIAEEFTFKHQLWDVQLLPWPHYRRSLLKDFERAVAEYEQKTRESAEALGLIRAPAKYSPVNLEWFALYQFAGMSSTEIADRAHGDADESAVLKGIKAAAKLIAWESLRKSRQSANRKIR